MAEPELAGFGKNADLNSFPETTFFSVEHGCIQKFCNKFAFKIFVSLTGCRKTFFLPSQVISSLLDHLHSG